MDSWKPLIDYAFLFIPIWFAWLRATYYMNYFETGDWLHRLYMLLQTLLMTGLALNIEAVLSLYSSSSGSYSDDYTIQCSNDGYKEADYNCEAFGGFYAAARLLTALMWLRVMFRIRIIATWCASQVFINTVVAILWILNVTLLGSNPSQHSSTNVKRRLLCTERLLTALFAALWWTSVGLDILYNAFPWFMRALNRYCFIEEVKYPPMNADLAEERHGLFVIIVLGECFVTASQSRDFTGWDLVQHYLNSFLLVTIIFHLMMTFFGT